MKIIYTNLQENDLGVKRSVRQFRVEFNKPGGERAHSAEAGILGEDERGGTHLSDRGSSVRNVGSGHGRLAFRENAESRHEDPQTAPGLPGCAVSEDDAAKRVTNVFVRRFIETKMRTLAIVENGGRINITI